MKNFYLYVIVFISGASVLAVEILGTRILGPFYGVSLFLWSALIAVTLVALSAGYMIGGRWADREAKFSRLCYLMVGAGIWLLLTPWIKHPVLLIAESLGLRFAVLVAAFILFAPPLTLLGMVSPYAIKVRAHTWNEVGRTAGDLYAISTIGSVIAALLTGFILIPNIGVNRLILIFGLLLIIGASFGLLTERKTKVLPLVGILLLICAAIATWILEKERPDPGKGLLAVEQSAYAEIRVLETEAGRYLLIDGALHSLVDPTDYDSNFEYVYVMDIARYFFEKPGKMLLLGVGGGTIIKNYARMSWEIDAVEIDPVVTQLAYQYFGLDSSEARIFHQDARQYLITRPDQYDIIIMDAFGSSSVPFHLVTREAFGVIAQRLQPEGVLAINLWANGWDDTIVRSVTATLKEHFSEVLALPIVEPPNKLGNMVLFAANRELEMVRELPPTLDRYSIDYIRNHAWDNRFTADTGNVPILSDDLNPVEVWSERINLVARRELHEYFRNKGIDW